MKIDTSKIEGYENMTPEEKVLAFEEFEIDEPQIDFSKYVSKDVFDKKMKEAKKYKTQLNTVINEEENKRLQEQKEKDDLINRLNALELEQKITKSTAAYLAMGYDEELAKSTAEAFVSGDEETFYQNQVKFKQSVIEQVKSDLMKNTPTPPAGSGTKGNISQKDFFAMSYEEKQAYMQENPNWKDTIKKENLVRRES